MLHGVLALHGLFDHISTCTNIPHVLDFPVLLGRVSVEACWLLGWQEVGYLLF